MREQSLESLAFRGLPPRTIGLGVALLLLFSLLWGTFVIVPAGSRSVILWWGSVEQRIMNEGLNFKVPLAETVMKVDVRVQPHPSVERGLAAGGWRRGAFHRVRENATSARDSKPRQAIMHTRSPRYWVTL